MANVSKALLLISSLALGSCATRPSGLTMHDFAAMSDRELCLSGLKLAPDDPAWGSLNFYYKRRQDEGRFTHAQCQALLQAQVAVDREASSQAASALLSGMAYQAGYAIGSRGRGPSSGPLYAIPSNPPVPPVIPYVPPPPPSFMLLTQTVNQSFTQKVCAYAGTSTVIILEPYQPCPQSVPR